MQNLPFLKSVKNKMSALLANVFFFCLFVFKKKTCGFSASILKIDKQITFRSWQLPCLFPEKVFII